MAFNDGQYGFFGEHGADGSATSSGSTNPNPFQRPGAPPMTRPYLDPMSGSYPDTMSDDSNRYGSAEQGYTRGRDGTNDDGYLNSMNNTGTTPRPTSPRTPRSPRARSQPMPDDDYEDRRRERAERREEHPIGVGFRLNACEQSLRDHHSELAAQRLMIEQLTTEMNRQMSEREEHRKRLDEVFNVVDKRYSEMDKVVGDIQTSATTKFESLTSTINGVAQGLAARIEQLVLDVNVLRREFQNAPPRAQPHSAPQPPPEAPQPPPEAPQPPPGVPRSWAGPTADASSHYPTSNNQSATGPTASSDSRQPSGSHFFIGSPLSGNQSAGANPPQFGGSASAPNGSGNGYMGSSAPAPNGGGNGFMRSPAATSNLAGAGTQYKPFDPRDWSTDGKKVSKELRTYDGDLATFDTWRMRVRNHFVGTNCNYTRIFELVEGNKVPIRWADLDTTQIPELPYVDWKWIATHLWTFTGNYLSDTQLVRRSTLVGGEEFNGLEYWRSLFSENVGGSAQLANLERGYFIAFPNCPNITELEPHLKQWVQLKNKYGMGLPEDHLIGMLWSVIPESMKEEIKKQKDLIGRLEAQINWVFGEIAERTDNKLSKWNLLKLQTQLKSKPRNTTGVSAVNVAGDGESAAVPSPPIPDMAAFAANMERHIEKSINAALTRTGRPSDRTPPGSRAGSSGSQRAGRRIPSASFKGCWCCGKEGHSRANCPEFEAIKKKHNGKVPKDYVGAWEKSLKAQQSAPSKKVAAIGVSSQEPSVSEHSETVPLWPVLPMPVPTSTHNKFGAFGDLDDEDDDESDVLKALAAITPNVSLASDRVSQRTRRANNAKGRPMDVTRLNAIAKEVRDGKISLPELDLANDSEYMYVWALVDSGAGANVARRSMFSESKPVDAPPINLSTASGESLPHSGAHRVTSYHRNGSRVARTFYDADVEMPILAVSELSKEGESGSEVRLRQRDGYIKDLHTGHRQHVVKRRGVYFTKMFIKKPRTPVPESGFIRPGTP